MEMHYDVCETNVNFKERSDLHINIVNQSLEQLMNSHPKRGRRFEHKYKSNNWLKLHNKTMRRKPFKKEFPSYMLDEFNNIT